MSLCDSIELSQGYSNSITLTQERNSTALTQNNSSIHLEQCNNSVSLTQNKRSTSLSVSNNEVMLYYGANLTISHKGSQGVAGKNGTGGVNYDLALENDTDADYFYYSKRNISSGLFVAERVNRTSFTIQKLTDLITQPITLLEFEALEW